MGPVGMTALQETYRHFIKLIDLHLIGVVVASLAATGVCRATDFTLDLPVDIIGIAVIFPIVFSIAGAYERREYALRSFATLKANAVALYFAHRDWPRGPEGLDAGASQLVLQLLRDLDRYFSVPESEQPQALYQSYRTYDRLSLSIEEMRERGVSSTEVSRVNQYLRDIMSNFELMRNFSLYRTPMALRAYSRLFVTVLPVLFRALLRLHRASRTSLGWLHHGGALQHRARRPRQHPG